MSFINQNPDDVRLTIKGFYYICMNRKSGVIEGVYFDVSCTPFQFLSLRPEGCGKGVAFASTKIC
ncbi:hypothetical protein H4S04_006896 [Coemansia sp. S16]|nr:hypothetical protein H4S04_006896 [Coemansia sp. S16]